MPIRLVLADDHPLILDGLENLFRLEPDFQVVARCKDGEEALKALRQHKPDVLILDLRMPRKDGLSVLREARAAKLSVRVIVLTAALAVDSVLEAARLGVDGIILKEMAPQMLVQCVRKVYAGEKWLERRSISQALEEMLRREEKLQKTVALLTARELEIVRMAAKGLRNKEISDKLSISEGTVKTHLHNIYEKLEVDGRMALLRYAQENGLV